MFDHLIPERIRDNLFRELSGLGIEALQPYSKGTTSVVFLGRLGEKRVIVKLQRPDSPRDNFSREAGILEAIAPFGVSPPLIARGRIENLSYIVREFAEGEPILYAEVEKRHLFQIAEKTALLDRLYLDHGQIQGGKHIIIGDRVYIIDFEKANWRKPNNLTSAMAMLFIGKNAISRRLYERFNLDESFREAMKSALRLYKREGKLSAVLDVLATL